jgi:hypothetical protein
VIRGFGIEFLIIEQIYLVGGGVGRSGNVVKCCN